jgi:hypothetical protein
MVVLRGAVWLVSIALILLTLLPLVRSPRWWIRVWDYPRLQLAIDLVLALVLQVTILPREGPAWSLTGATLVFLGWQLLRLA